MTEGFDDLRGAIFGFGPKANNDTDTTLKIEGVSQAKRRKLVNAPIHILNEERSVGFINYEISIRGKQHLEAPSRKMIINKSSDILDQAEPSDIRNSQNQQRRSRKLR